MHMKFGQYINKSKARSTDHNLLYRSKLDPQNKERSIAKLTSTDQKLDQQIKS